MDDVRNVKDEAKVNLADALRFANEHLSPAEMAKEIYEAIGEGGSVAHTKENRLAEINQLIRDNVPRTQKEKDGLFVFVHNIAKEFTV